MSRATTKPKTTPKKAARQTAFKVVSGDGKSIHGGDHAWSLPKNGRAGAWHTLPAGTKPELCVAGFHLTQKPAEWWRYGCAIYIAEWRGRKSGPSCSSEDDKTKFAAAECRLLREATADELFEVGIITSGNRTVNSGSYIVSGTAVVTASGSAQVTASGSAQVTAYGSAQVTASGSAQVTAYGSAQVTAYGSAQVTAYGSAQVTKYSSFAKATLANQAVCIDWTSGRAELVRAA